MQRQYVVKLDDYDQRIMIRALNDLRSTLIKEERPTDAVDELMVKVYGAKKSSLYQSRGQIMSAGRKETIIAGVTGIVPVTWLAIKACPLLRRRHVCCLCKTR